MEKKFDYFTLTLESEPEALLAVFVAQRRNKTLLSRHEDGED